MTTADTPPRLKATPLEAPPVVRITKFTCAGKKRTLDLGDENPNKEMCFEENCVYYVTTTMDVMTSSVYFLHILKREGDEINYKMTLQPMSFGMERNDALNALTYTPLKTSNVKKDLCYETFKDNELTINACLAFKL
ncbi:MAG: hypothetical protein CMB67_04390 [Euryarchaeota archaeon]|nr:hypothetical protein [Euryarchaeota archaeon]|tara:strand:+ start:5813 stop:6223 length:411 start_codon:yes stop_codon:yes gene_type:complete